MLIDFTPVTNGSMKMADFAQGYTIDQLRDATNASINHILGIVREADDRAVAFVPHDPNANDPYAAPDEQNVGWTLGHVIAHVTASSEEYAAVASVLARGIAYPREPRLRYETPWQEISTKLAAVQRLEESRRIRLGYLATFPDKPNLTVLRDLSERYLEKFGPQNAITAVLMGLYHESQHYEQMREALRQAQSTVGAAGN